MITQQRLNELFIYDKYAGKFIRRVAVGRHGRYKKGQLAGTKTIHGYIIVGVDGKRYMAHRLVWLYMYNVWPSTDLDHINQDKSDNRIDNLREVTRSQNMQNVTLHAHNSSGHKGVSWLTSRAKWRAYIFVNRQQTHLGLFSNIEDAIKARKNAELTFHTHGV
jgi:hypothetical protein